MGDCQNGPWSIFPRAGQTEHDLVEDSTPEDVRKRLTNEEQPSLKSLKEH